MTDIPNRGEIASYFIEKLQAYGASARGADWNGSEAQAARFEQFLKLFDSKAFSILDYGCGYGALADYLEQKGFDVEYHGFDMLEDAIDVARQQHRAGGTAFHSNRDDLPVCDYTVASGIFNYRGSCSMEAWTNHVLQSLHQFHNLSRKGFASNFLTSYSDLPKMRPDLYYADPKFLFDYCKRHISKNVAILHDYDLYDFTLIVRAER